jgi:uncharacterized protein YkwD
MQRAGFCCLVTIALVAAAASAQNLEKYPRTVAELKQGLNQIENARPAGNAPGEQVAALRRLNAYRFLCGVPADVRFDDEQAKYAQAGAELLAKIGRLDHQPENPGLPDEEYQAGLRGTSHSNIYWGTDSSPRMAIEYFMHDSDEHNIARLGHRRWCLNPSMLTTGFGHSGVYVCMWSFDRSRRDIPDWQIIAYPCRGFVPVNYFSADRAWSVTVNPQHFAPPTADFEVKISPLDRKMAAGEPLEIELKGFNDIWMGPPNVMIFRPKNLDMTPGRRYSVEINTAAKVGAPATLRYIVEFVDLAGGQRRDR